MSHLTTLIGRVQQKLQVYEQDLAELANDSSFEQSVINLMEYVHQWDDYTMDELTKALALYDTCRPVCTGLTMPSHRQRLKEADEIRQFLNIQLASTLKRR